MIHLYAFADELASLPARTGVAGEPLEPRALDGVVAVVGAVPAAVPETPAAVLAHGLVVESLLEHGPSILPARFAEPFADDASLVAATTPRLAQLRDRLARVRGCVEVAVRAVQDEPETVEGAASGTSYMQGLAAATGKRAAAAAALHAPLERSSVESRIQPPGRDRTVLQAAYLVRADEVAAFANRVERLAAAHPELTVVCTGPWAPYSFAEEER